MDLLWWCNQFQRLDFRIETIHHPPCQGKVYLHTAVTLCSLWIPRAQEDPVEENTFCCVFPLLLRSEFGVLTVTAAPEHPGATQGGAEGVTYATAVLQYPVYLFCHDSCRLCYESFPNSLFYFRINKAFYQVEFFRGREYSNCNRNDEERAALVQILPNL